MERPRTAGTSAKVAGFLPVSRHCWKPWQAVSFPKPKDSNLDFYLIRMEGDADLFAFKSVKSSVDEYAHALHELALKTSILVP